MLPVYAINLDRSVKRWENLSASAAAAGMELTRIAAVDGKAIPADQRQNVSEKTFRNLSGRGMRPGEYGCYQSHLAALRQLLNDNVPAGIIVEDDIRFPPDFMARAQAVLAACPQAEVIKLVNHRVRGFRAFGRSQLGDRVGRCLHGPQGSAACYLVSASGARKLLEAMGEMILPFDVDLERGWKTGAATFTVERDLAALDRTDGSEIGTRADYRKSRSTTVKRIPTHLFRIFDYVSRMLYSIHYK